MAGVRVLLFFALFITILVLLLIFGPIEFECRARDSDRYELNTVHRKSQHIHMDHGRHAPLERIWALGTLNITVELLPVRPRTQRGR